MKIDPHRETVATQPVSTTINASVIHRDLSISQAIEQALADTSKPSPEQLLAELILTLPGVGGRADLHHAPSSADSGEDGGPDGFSLGDLATAAAALRNFGVADLTSDSGKHNIYDDLIGGSRQSREELAGLSGNGSQGNGSQGNGSQGNGSQGNSIGDGTVTGGQGNGTGGQADPHDRQNPYAGMFEQSAGSTIAPVHYDDDGVRAADGGKTAGNHKDGALGRIGGVIGSGGPAGPTRDAHEQAKLEDDLASGRATQHTSSDGKVTSTKHEDGTITVENKDNGTKTTLKPDGSSTTTTTTTDKDGKTTTTTENTPAPKCPDEEHEYTGPEWLTEQIKEDLSSIYRGSHDNDEITPDDSDAGSTFATVGSEASEIVDPKDLLLGGDTDLEGALNEGGTGNVPSQNGDDINWGPDHDETPQTSGPERRDTSREVKRDAPSSEDTGGQQGDGSDQDSSRTTTPALEAAQKLKDALNHDDTPDRDKIEPHEKLPVPDTGPGPGPGPGQGPGSHLDAGNAFADLIRAQNPAQLGLLSKQPALPEADAMLQLTVKADFAGQSFGPHGDLHAAAATPPSVADSPVEHHAPMLEHFQIGHH